MAYVVIERNVDDYFGHYFGDYIVDSDGDQLTYSMPELTERQRLRDINVEFNPITITLTGKPTKTGVWTMNKV